jgi:flagellar basal body-associated protein FliL
MVMIKLDAFDDYMISKLRAEQIAKAEAETKQKNCKAIPLQTVIIVTVAIGFLISCFLICYMHHSSRVYSEMREATQDYTDCQAIASDLLAKSDAMTIYARGFVVTGDLQQAELYYNDPEVQNAIGKALEDIHAYSTDERVLSQLNNAIQLRNRLSVTEDYAMRLKVASIGGDISEYPKSCREFSCFRQTVSCRPRSRTKRRAICFLISITNPRRMRSPCGSPGAWMS